MGFTINETIKTELHYKDVALIAVAMGIYQEQYKDVADKDNLLYMKQKEDEIRNVNHYCVWQTCGMMGMIILVIFYFL